MNVFVSHSIIDKALITQFDSALKSTGIKLIVAEHHFDVERTVTEKIKDQIRSADFALILLTKNGFDSKFVQQEIGFINSQKMPFIQLVEKGIEKQITGFNFGREYISYDRESPEKSIEKTKDEMIKFLTRKRKKEQIKKTEEQKTNNQLKIGLGILASLIALAFLLKD